MVICDMSRLNGIYAGRAGENMAREIAINLKDCIARHPGATVTMLIKRPGEDAPYPVNTSLENGLLIWRPNAADTAIPGTGEIEIRVMDGEMLEKSMVGSFTVSRCISGTATEPPEGAKCWVQSVVDAAERAEEAAKRAEQASEALGPHIVRSVNSKTPDKNGNVDISETVLEFLIQLDIAPVLVEKDNAVLTDGDGAVLLNVKEG